MRRISIRAIFCPHETFRDRPEQVGPQAPGIELKLTKNGSAKSTYPTTDDHGVFVLNVEPGEIYTVEKDDVKDGYTVDKCEIDHDSSEDYPVPVYPAEHRWRLTLHALQQTATGVQPLRAGRIRINSESYEIDDDGDAFALIPADGRIAIDDIVVDDVTLVPQQRAYRLSFNDAGNQGPMPVEILFQEQATVRIAAQLLQPNGSVAPLDGLSFTLTDGSGGPPTLGVAARGEHVCVLRVLPGTYRAAALPFSVRGYPISAVQPMDEFVLGPGEEVTLTPTYTILDARLVVSVATDADGPLAGVPVTFTNGTEVVHKNTDPTGLCGLASRAGAVWSAAVPQHWTDPNGEAYVVTGPVMRTTALSSGDVRTLQFIADADSGTGVRGQVLDRQGNPQAGLVVDAFDDMQRRVASAVTDSTGRYEIPTPASGQFYVALRRNGDRLEQRTPVQVSSWVPAAVLIVDPEPPTPLGTATSGAPASTNGGSGDGERRESLVDLTAYPLMTEDVNTRTGGWGAGAQTPGRGEGPAVEQVVRDVLGWRPRVDDVSGFQAALTGAFELDQVEGHTAWQWRPRGYAVQADMGAVTGAQASIYARARNALEQLVPLLDALTPLDPAVDMMDAEATRSIVRTEVTELVSELGVEGGPRLQRVDDLFVQLTGFPVTSSPSEPNDVEGQLGALADRFGLTPDRVNTLDEERILTNFRIVVEHVLALATSWKTDRKLFDPSNPSEFLGISLIRLSRNLEAVADATDDLVFALDSVFIGAGERQVIEVKRDGGPAILLSDLLDWIRKAVTVEGRQLIQDAGKDGVAAFAPVLKRLSGLVSAARGVAGTGVPPGFQTPRVQRALRELAKQLNQAAVVAGGVQRETAPTITAAFPTGAAFPQGHTICIFGTNFRNQAVVEFSAPGGRVRSLPTVNLQSSSACTVQMPSGSFWTIQLVNFDGTRSNRVDVDLTL